MKTKFTLLALLFLAFNVSFAQQDQEAMAKLSIFHEYVKAKNYDAAYEPWMDVRKKAPKFNNAIYIDGEKILEHKIEKTSGSEKVAYINDLLKLWEERETHFSSKTPKGEYAAKACQLMYDYRKELNKTDAQLFECFDAAYKLDKETFTNPKSLYTYFSLMVDLYDDKKKTAAELFSKYDDVSEKVEEEVRNYSENLNKIIEKKDAGTALSSKEKQYEKYYESYLKAYDQISGSINSKLGDRANCENLMPIYERDFPANKGDAVWLKRAVSNMFYKECTEDPLYEKLVKAYDAASPSADTKVFVAGILLKNGKTSEAEGYFNQAYELERDSFKKAKLAERIGSILKGKGRYAQARSYYNNSLKYNPSNGRPHLAIAAMYAASAKDCGSTNFEKRAVFWLAANEARKAARVDPTLSGPAAQSAASYEAKAPTKAEIFSAGNAGQTLSIGCWIGSSVTVPNI